MTYEEIERAFTYHPPIGDQIRRYAIIRSICKSAASEISALCPPSRELDHALLGLQECCMWANAAIARNEARDSEMRIPTQ